MSPGTPLQHQEHMCYSSCSGVNRVYACHPAPRSSIKNICVILHVVESTVSTHVTRHPAPVKHMCYSSCSGVNRVYACHPAPRSSIKNICVILLVVESTVSTHVTRHPAPASKHMCYSSCSGVNRVYACHPAPRSSIKNICVTLLVVESTVSTHVTRHPAPASRTCVILLVVESTVSTHVTRHPAPASRTYVLLFL